VRRVLPAVGLAAAAAASGVAFGAVYGGEHILPTAAFFAACGAPVLALAHLLARRRARLGGLSRQFAVAVALAIGLVLVAVGAAAVLMFASAHDLYLLALLLVFAGGLGAYTAWLFAREVGRDIETLRDGLAAVGEGRRGPIATGGADEISQLASSASEMVRRLAAEEAERAAGEQARRDLVAAVSHDLRTPLTSLRLLSDAVEDGLIEREESHAQISLHVRALGALVDDLFELTRLEAGDIQWSMRRVRLDELIRETVEAMRAQAAVRNVAVEARLPRGLALAQANPEKLQRVLFNLIQNAIRHTPADGSVTITAESSGEDIEIEVADTGAGIAAGERERVFEPFFRAGADASRTEPGSGLGLAICRAIVEVHGGRIWVEGDGAGARVRFSVPRALG
jgi:signal transduction histidine kinase